MIEFITQHPTLCAFGGYLVFSALAGGMPKPEASSSIGYQWMFASLQILAMNINHAVATRYPALDLPAGSAVAQHTDTTITTPKV